MYAIIGLGNPGKEYENTRHNVGFDVIDLLAKRMNVTFTNNKGNTKVAQCFISGKKVLLVKPQTYMNESGISVHAIMDYYNIPLENILVIYDDIDLLPGNLRIRKKGSAGTHNGMRSILAHVQNENFPRIRVGIGGRPSTYTLVDWVLGHYNKQEWEIALASYEQASDAVVEYVQNGIESAMQHFSTKKQKPKKEVEKIEIENSK